MALNLADYDRQAREAVMAFWGNRAAAAKKQAEAGVVDVGERAGVTGGANMDGFVALILDLVRLNGPVGATVHRAAPLLVLPGYFRPTKGWDVLVIHRSVLIAAIELKSHAGPSFSNNFNSRCEEAIGSGHDFRTAQREGRFGPGARPFVAWFMLVEDAPGSRRPVRERFPPRFPAYTEFAGSSYIRRYQLLCQRLTREGLYDVASVISAPRSSVDDGTYSDAGDATGLRSFVSAFAGHVAAEAAWLV